MNKLRKFNTFLLTVLAIVLVAALLVACDKTPETPTPTPSKKDITGVTFSNVTVNYDGKEHSITVSGDIPEGVTVSYTNNKGTDTGTYNATATLTGEEYNTLTLNATLTIVGSDITGITLTDATVPYDKLEHSLTITGELPQGVTVTYTYDGQAVSGATNYGAHTVVATLSGKGYNTKTLTATLTIEAKDITGVTFANRTETYDGGEYTLSLVGELPTGVTSNITGNTTGTDAGTYSATAEIWGIGYKPLTLTATLTINPAEITGVSLSGITELEYDGQPHSLVVAETLPAGVSVSYTYNGTAATSATDAGNYNVVATLSGKNYVTKTLDKTLTINKATISQANLTFADATVEYDAKQHSIVVVGNPPVGVTITYYYDGVEATSIAYPGEHTVEAVLASKNHNALTLTATLTITSSEEMLYSATFGSYIYFQNSLDGNRLYRATGSGAALSKVSNDVATYFTSNGSSLYFYSASLFSQTIKSLSYQTGTTKLDTVFNPGRATYLASDSNGNIYYAKANLVDTKGENGIYKVHIDEESTEEFTPVRLTTDKANYIAYYNGYIYYCNNSDGSKLYRISVSAGNGTGQKLTDNKVSDIVVADGVVYYTLHTLTNSSIQKYNISSGTTTSLCIDNGAYLTKVGNYIYYVNKDLLTSNVFGKGIYRVSINGGATVGEKVIDASETGECYYSLASDGTDLYYYKMSDKHFYRYNVSTEAETDLMQNFVPVETTTISAFPYVHLATYNGELYYTDVLDSNSLYKYNPNTNATFKVLADSVSNVYFHEDYMYYSTYVFTNYALWRLDLSDPEAEPIKISSHRYEHLIFETDYIYALRVQPPIIVGQSNTNRIVRLDLDGQNETVLYMDKNVHITSMYLHNGKFHFTINPAIGYKYIYTHDFDGEEKQSANVGEKSDKFVIVGDRYYYYEHTANKLMSCDFNGKNVETLVSNVDISYIYEKDGIIYYTSENKQNTGIYAHNVASGTTTKLTDKVGYGFEILGGKLYFVNITLTLGQDYPHYSTGDGHLYGIDLSNNTVTKVK